jgi:hypothetical protein
VTLPDLPHPEGRVLLRALAADGDAALCEWARAAPEPGWSAWLAGHGLAAYACHRLRRAGALSLLPPRLAESLAGAYYLAAADAELHGQELAAVLRALAAARLTPLVFKGAALACTAYPDPACRPMGDIDLWLPAAAMPAAQAALLAAGYRLRTRADRPPGWQADRDGEIQLMGGAAGQGLVELHYGVFAGEWSHRTMTVDADGLFCRARPATLAGCPAWTLSPEDAIIQLAVHLAVNHQMAYPGLRGLLDVVLLGRTGHADWSVVAERAREWRVATATWLVLSLADDLLGLPRGGADAVADLCPSAARRRGLAGFTGHEAMLDGKDISRGPARFLFQLLLVDRTAAAMRLLRRALWPEAGWLAARYGETGARVRVHHLGSVLRGRV